MLEQFCSTFDTDGELSVPHGKCVEVASGWSTTEGESGPAMIAFVLDAKSETSELQVCPDAVVHSEGVERGEASLDLVASEKTCEFEVVVEEGEAKVGRDFGSIRGREPRASLGNDTTLPQTCLKRKGQNEPVHNDLQTDNTTSPTVERNRRTAA
jgi:hypothetical protein